MQHHCAETIAVMAVQRNSFARARAVPSFNCRFAGQHGVGKKLFQQLSIVWVRECAPEQPGSSHVPLHPNRDSESWIRNFNKISHRAKHKNLFCGRVADRGGEGQSKHDLMSNCIAGWRFHERMAAPLRKLSVRVEMCKLLILYNTSKQLVFVQID